MWSEDNPYRSPASEDADDLSAPAGAGLRICAQPLYRGWLFRRIQIAGDVNAVVEYNGRWSHETVSVDGKVVSRQRARGDRIWRTLVPHFDLTLPCGQGFVPATVDIRGVIRIAAFRLTVEGVVVYSEGTW